MKKGGLFKTIRVFAVLSVALMIAIVLVIMRPKAERQVPVDKGLLVEVLPAQAENVQMVVEAFGTVAPREALKLVAQVRGQIVAFDPAFKEGRFVEKQTRLIQIDPRSYSLAVERGKVQIQQAEAELKRLQQEVVNLEARIKIANSDVKLAENDYLRLKALVDRKVIAQSQLDKSEQAYLASQERLQALNNQMALIGPQKEQLIAARDMARVMYQEAALDLERSSIVAPFDGWVLEKFVEVGQHVNIGQELGRIYSAGELDIEVRIPARDLKWFPEDLGQDRPISADVVFKNGGSNTIWEGRVARIKAMMDQRTRTLPMVVEVDDTSRSSQEGEPFRLRPGLFVTVRIKGKKVENVFVLPRYLIYPGDVVYTVAAETLKSKQVEILRGYKDTVIVGEGLSEGDLIVTSPLSSPVDGQIVRLKPDGS
ncbi:MAG: efflux RND transporter periplasmic adaptor subunit [Deltaproteobacteria bacterium]|jgi:multidrug efflux pump subunit AcrA (membrane-fusion protein)|nr:efflux RND transporter periplasmic adaptor subunit [Deltaproteobacteria bacterium]